MEELKRIFDGLGGDVIGPERIGSHAVCVKHEGETSHSIYLDGLGQVEDFIDLIQAIRPDASITITKTQVITYNPIKK